MLVTVRRMSQLMGLLILISMIFVLLSVGSYSLDDPAWNYYTSHEVIDIENLGGRMGAFIADWGLQLFGSTVFVFIACTALGAICLMRARMRPVIGAAWRGLLLMAVVSTLAHLYWVDDPFFKAGLLAGGVSGQWLAEFLAPYLKVSGTYAVVGLSALVVLLSGTRLSLFRRVRRLVGTARLTRGRRESDDLFLFDEGQDPSPCPAGFQDDPDPGVPAAAPSEIHASKAPKPPSFLAQRATKSQQRPQMFTRRTISEKSGREEALLDKRPMSEDNVVDLSTGADQTTPSEARAPEVSTLQLLSVKHVTPPQQAQLPSLDLLDVLLEAEGGQSDAELMEQARFLEQKLREFGVEGEVVQVSPGPVITMYEFAPAAGVKVNKIANLQDDLALVMRALSVRIVAPIPGKAVVGIEVPNVRRETIALRSLLDTEAFQSSSSKLSIALGKDILGQPVVTDLALIPHLLVAGATGSGKSVGLNSVICSLLFRVTPAEVRLIMIDPKMLEFSIYDGIPHLLVPVVTDAKKAAVALRRVVAEMERRYQLLAARGVRSIAQYNQKIRAEQANSDGGDGVDAGNQSALAEPLPYLVVVVDELSDLMMVSSREVEDSLMRIAQMARAAGIHLIVATQRPSVDVLTGVIKANFPARLSFQVTSKTDSRTILDANGAETLLGRGDMLFLAPGTSKPQRVHGAYVSEAEIARLVAAWKAIEQPSYNSSFLEPINERVDDEDSEYDEKYDEAVDLVARTGQASISMLQRRLRVGYNRAARMIEVMEKEGVVGPADGVKPREVLARDTYDEV